MAVMMCMVFTACSSDDDDEGGNGNSISGKWINKNYQKDLVDHYKLWKNDNSGLYVSDGSFAVFEFSSSSVKFYHYIYTFDGKLKNNPNKNNSFVKLPSATYNGVNVTWYANLLDTYPYVLKDNSLIIGNSYADTGVFENGKLTIGRNEYERFK